MTAKQQAYAKRLRRQIMAARVARGWDSDEFYSYLCHWGFGISLRALNIDQLLAVQAIMHDKSSPRRAVTPLSTAPKKITFTPWPKKPVGTQNASNTIFYNIITSYI